MQPRELDPSVSVPAYFGAELRRYRKAADLTQEELGEKVNYTGALISMIEAAKRTPTRQFAEVCDRVLATGGALARVWPLVNRASYPSWFRGFVELEATATTIRSFECQLIPGLLQTEDYARAVFRFRPERFTATQIDELVAARASRQNVLTSPAAPMAWFILDEAILHRPVGGAIVMRAQLAHLLAVADASNLFVQVVPFQAGEYPGLDGGLTILSFADGPDVGYIESHADSAMLIHSPDQAATCSLAYDLIRAVALSPKLSADLIGKAMENL
jgi:transcriptional regulator with XRE-family HTH domain